MFGSWIALKITGPSRLKRPHSRTDRVTLRIGVYGVSNSKPIQPANKLFLQRSFANCAFFSWSR